MPNSTTPSLSMTISTSDVTHGSGAKLQPPASVASSISGAPIIYTPLTTSEVSRTPPGSIASALATAPSSLNVVFARLIIEDRRKALRSLQNAVLREALGCTSREVAGLIVTAPSDELWAAFCQLNVENKRRSLESVRKSALRKAFREESGDKDASGKIDSHSASVAFEATTNILNSAFKRLNVEDQEKALAGVQLDYTPKKDIWRGTNGCVHNDYGEREDNDDTLLDAKPDLAEWQELCRACGVEAEEIPSSITKCKEVLKTKNVALSDLTIAIRNGTVAQTFPSLNQLKRYVKEHKKVANKVATKENRFLKRMLRELFRHRNVKVGGIE